MAVHFTLPLFKLLLFLLDFICIIIIILKIFRERRREGEREGEKHQCVVTSPAPPTGDLARNPGMCPDLGIKLVTLCFADQRSIH